MAIKKAFIKSCSIDARNKQSPTCEVVLETKESSLQTSPIDSLLAQLVSMGLMIWRLWVQIPLGTIFDEIYFVLCNSCARGDFGIAYVKLSPPSHKVTSHGHSHLTSTSHAPLHIKIISFFLHGKIPEKSRSNPNSITKVPLTSHQIFSETAMVKLFMNQSEFGVPFTCPVLSC